MTKKADISAGGMSGVLDSVALPSSASSKRMAISCANRRFLAALPARSFASLPGGVCRILVETKCCLPSASRYDANQYERFDCL
jgi:hypothetical protein